MTDPMAGGASPAVRARHADGAGPAFAAPADVGKRKQSAVLRLLRGDNLELVSPGSGG